MLRSSKEPNMDIEKGHNKLFLGAGKLTRLPREEGVTVCYGFMCTKQLEYFKLAHMLYSSQWIQVIFQHI